MIKRETLKTEQQNKKTIDIDQFPIFKVLETINDEDRKISAAVKKLFLRLSRLLGLQNHLFCMVDVFSTLVQEPVVDLEF